MGEEVLTALSPSQQVIKIVHEELIKILGSHESKLRFANEPPSVFLIVGLQGSGKTTSTGKLARWLSQNGHRPHDGLGGRLPSGGARAAARSSRATSASPIYEGTPEETLPARSGPFGAPREPPTPAATCCWWIPPAACTSTIS